MKIRFQTGFQMSFSQLPVEMLERIFLYLDGVSFCRVKTVCKEWQAIQRKLKPWQMFCRREIPNEILEDLLTYKSISIEYIDWKKIYQKWYSGQLTLKNKVEIYTIVSTWPVTCMKSSGSLIVTGHGNGHFFIWSQINGEGYHYVRCHSRVALLYMITDLALVDLKNLGPYYDLLSLPWYHHHMIIVSNEDTCIRIFSLLDILNDDKRIILNEHQDGLLSIRVFGNQLAVHCQDNSVSLWSLYLQDESLVHLNILLLRTISGPQDILKNLGFWAEKIYCISHAGKLKVHDPRNDEWLEETSFKRCLLAVCENRPIITSYHLFRNKIIIVCTASGVL